MMDRETSNEEKDQSNGDSNESFDDLLQKKHEAEQQLKKKFTRVMTLMQSDIKGSTDFQQTRGDIEAAAILSVHKKLLDPILPKYGGKVISEATDGAFVAFENSPENAVKASIEFMQEVHKYNEGEHNKLNIRIALNHGPVIVKGEGHITGLTVSTTARVEQSMKAFEKKSEAIAGTSLIFVSGPVYNEIRNSEDIICRWVEQVEAKGLDKPLDLYRVVWDLKQEQIIQESAISSRVTRGKDDDGAKSSASVPDKRNVFILEITKEDDRVKICGYENVEHEHKTVRQYDIEKVDFKEIDNSIQKITGLLNLATQKGAINKKVLNDLKAAGQSLYDGLLTENIKGKVAKTSSEDLIINIDDHLVHIPWELLYDGSSFLCLRFNMGRVISTRQAITEGPFRPVSLPLKMLVLADPKNNLKTASTEGHGIKSKLELASNSINVNVKSGNIQSTFVVEKIHNFDIVHYAGHSDHDPANPSQSGWLLEDKKLMAENIRMMGGSQPMPSLVFSNACQSGQTDKWEISDDYENKIYGMANAFLLAGVNHYVGTFWEVLDEPSSDFAISFYEQVSKNKPIGEAIRLARKDLIKKYGEETIIWASYMLYGDPSFCYVRPVVHDDATPVKGVEQFVYAQAGGETRSGDGPFGVSQTSKSNTAYWLGGIAAAILIVLILLFFRQTTQTEVLVKSVQQTQAEMARQKAEIVQDKLKEKIARQRQIAASEQKEKSKKIDALVAELANRYREGVVSNKEDVPVDEWVSRPLIVSLFPLKTNMDNGEAYQEIVFNSFAEYSESSDRVSLVDRELIDKLLVELKLSSSDLADKQTALRIGNLVGARFIAFGSIYKIGKDSRLSMKLIETETTSIVKTGSQNVAGQDSLSPHSEKVSRELLDALVSKFPLRARIIGLTGDNVVINIGKDHGMAKDTVFNVYREQEIEGSNAVINANIGTIKIKNVEGEVSTGIVLTKTEEFEKNMKIDEAL